jgi:Ca2+-binding EF-hand superfamily protein
MSKKRAAALYLSMAMSVVAVSDASAAKRHARSAADSKVEQLIRLMDKDKNGQVSKAEFTQFMEEEFDRLDVDKSGGLTREELSRSIILRGQHMHTGGTGK